MYCLACTDEIENDSSAVPVLFVYQCPGDPEQEILAYLCYPCGNNCVNNPPTYFATEAVVNARVARMRNPDKKFGPG